MNEQKFDRKRTPNIYAPVSSVLKMPSPPQHIAAIPPTGRTSTVTEDSKQRILFPSTSIVSRSASVFLITVPMAMRNAHSPFSTVWTITIVFAFLINNYLTYAGDWPGPLSFYNSFNIFNLTQLLIYLVAILFPLLFLNLYGNNYNLSELADIFEGINGYIIRFGFWSVLIIGVIAVSYTHLTLPTILLV